MDITTILNEVLALAAIILPFAGLPAYAALIAGLLPRIDALITKLTATAAQTNAWTPEQAAEFQAWIDALRADPAWQIDPLDAAVEGLGPTGPPAQNGFTISGAVKDAFGPLPGVTILLGAPVAVATVTDAHGAFITPPLHPDSYVVTPVLVGYTFEPASVPVTLKLGNVAGLGFVATRR